MALNKRSLIALICLWGVALTAHAELKIGVVNISQVMEQAPQAEAAIKRLESEFGPREKKFKAQEASVKSMEERLSRDGAVMSEDKRKELERDILSSRRDLKRDQEEAREDFNIRRNEERGRLNRQVIETIRQLALDEAYDLILTEGILFASDRTNITKQVVGSLQKQFEQAKKAPKGGSAK